MEIQKLKNDDVLELKIQGRLDAYWSDHLTAALDESIRGGSRVIQVNLAQVDYLSSAGIRVLLKFYKQLKETKGSLAVTAPSEGARAILSMAGLAGLLISAPPVAPEEKVKEPERVEKPNAVYYVYDVNPGAVLKCTLIGDPAKLEKGGFTECQNEAFPESTFGVGVGAFGSGFADCKDRFGEFLALEGAAACLPTDGAGVPDYVLTEGALVPEIKVLYALTGYGAFAHLIRFDAIDEPPGVIPFGDLVERALEFSKSDLVGVAMIAESAGLVGAAPRRSPGTVAGGESPLGFPAAREWLDFAAERAFERSLCVVVGVASRAETPVLKSILRPVGSGTKAVGHFHAAAFPHRAMQRGELSLHKTLNALFATESLRGLLHLLADDREIDGVGQSEFIRGALWVGPIPEVVVRL